MIFTKSQKKPDAFDQQLADAYRADEAQCVQQLIKDAALPHELLAQIHDLAKELVIATRAQQKEAKEKNTIQAFLQKYTLSSEEGVALMCLAEALLRIPDKATADQLISDRLSAANWDKHTDQGSDSLFANAASWSLAFTGKLLSPTTNSTPTSSFKNTLKQLLARTSAPLVRPMVMQGMKMLGQQFVIGESIEDALSHASSAKPHGYRYSYDMLGEAAKTQHDAQRYFETYLHAIETIGKKTENQDPITGPGISIKLSALHPRYEFSQYERVMTELLPRLIQLAEAAAEKNMGFTIDAEEANRLTLSLALFEKLVEHPALSGWQGLGLAVQAYQKRAPMVIDWLTTLAKQHQRRIMVRLIKGAYWDTEIRQSQLEGLAGYPVFTRKHTTDLCWIACAKKLLAHPDCFYPQFGTHNAYSVAVILALTKNITPSDFEFQCLYGMGETLYNNLVTDHACRIYAPVGTHQDLLSYLVRRLLENGANSSFIHLMTDESCPIEKIIEDPVAKTTQLSFIPHPHIPLPRLIYGPERLNALGMDLTDKILLENLKTTMDAFATDSAALFHTTPATTESLEIMLQTACDAKKTWGNTPLTERATLLKKAADLFEKNTPQLMTLLCLEGKKQLADCLSEVRETIDFCRYYALQAEKTLAKQILTGPTGELNELSLHPRGVIACISPWNFPLAIFTGQITAALVCGNTVIAKPAEQTPRIAAFAIQLLHEAGIPKDALQLARGSGAIIGARLAEDTRVDGIMFTGSTETARRINQTLATRDGPIVPFIAETGGQNAMIVDSSALPEQVVTDVIQSAFNSAGQRCSALRVLFLQEDVAPRILDMLAGAMQELQLGDPSLLATDIGPVIDHAALTSLENHRESMLKNAKLICEVPAKNLPEGNFFRPCVFELDSLSLLKGEVFGPILHVIRYAAKELDNVLDSIRQTGYGLTLGIHSRIQSKIRDIAERMPVGNIYVNRNMIGATVGVQPFGGEGLSGTGPKAGGPHYLTRLCVERTLSINMTAAGGNTTLVSLKEE